MPTHENRLIHEKSPYLLQHAHNPVDWFPWGEEAFALAKAENKPVFLSIGYATCHWCHVMERESFEDEETAALMNQVFVNIKVDREERPDLDGVYMTVCNLMTGQGGWPLTVLLTPEKEPFFAGTYIPKESKFGRVGMKELMARVQDAWRGGHDEVLKSARQITAHVQSYLAGELQAQKDAVAAAPEVDESLLETAYAQFAEKFDADRGGFGDAPKFPAPHILLFLLRMASRRGKDHALAMVEQTLAAMRAGGLFDHVGFGFHRYSTDRQWLLPHFEKMLYDQAMLTLAYLEAFQITGKPAYGGVAREVLTYVLRDLRDPLGGFHSAEDADSEGEEGKFYVFTIQDLERALDPEVAAVAIKAWGVKLEGNFHDESTGQLTGANILHLAMGLERLAEATDKDEETLKTMLQQARETLFRYREQRQRPLLDDKVLTDWNGLMIAAAARAGRVLDMPEYTDAAAKAADFILTTLRTADGRLLHRFRDGEAGLPAHADDYAFMAWGCTELYEATFEPRYLSAAHECMETLIHSFWDEEKGGFFFTAADEEVVLARRKDAQDAAAPSANSTALVMLVKLGRMLGKPEYESMADRLVKAFAQELTSYPAAFAFMLCGVEAARGDSQEIVLAGDPDHDDFKALKRMVDARFLPGATLLCSCTELGALAPWTTEHAPLDGQATAYVCVNRACKRPVNTTTELQALLEGLDFC